MDINTSGVIIALDFSSLSEVKEFLKKFQNQKLFVKIGMELFYSEGPAIVDYIKNQGHDIFLDLKLMDIPNTVNKAMKNLAKMGVDLTNVHSVGGIDMMKAAKEGFSTSNNQGKLIAVTYLTSVSKEILNNELLIQGEVSDAVIAQAKNTQIAGLDGVVCSAQEPGLIHQATSQDFLTITPGIRPLWAAVGDQKRVVTPKDAKKNGSDYIVVGRPITGNEDPQSAYSEILADFSN